MATKVSLSRAKLAIHSFLLPRYHHAEGVKLNSRGQRVRTGSGSDRTKKSFRGRTNHQTIPTLFLRNDGRLDDKPARSAWTSKALGP